MLQGLQILLVCAALLINVGAIVVRKCCPNGYIVYIGQYSSDTPPIIECKESNLTWAPDLFVDDANVTWSVPENVTSDKELNIDCKFQDVLPLFGITKEIVYFESESLVQHKQPGVKYSEFCLEQEWRGITFALTCPCIKGGICVNFCCPFHELLDTTTSPAKCVTADNITQPTLTLNVSEQLYNIKINTLPMCSAVSNNEPELLNMENKQLQYEFDVLANGTLFIHSNYSKIKGWKDPNEYCVGIIRKSNESKLSMNVLLCKKDQTQINRRAKIYVTLFIIGGIFLVATLVVHTLVPNMRRSLRGLSLMAHCASMLAAHITLAVAQVIGATVTDLPCHIIGGFFWLNVMCLDIGNAFRSLKSMARCLKLDYSIELRKFQWYCVYAFGVPFILMLVTMVVDHSGLHYMNTFKPNIGQTSCWFELKSTAIILFFFGPIGLLLLINLVLFIHVSYKILSEDAQLRNIPCNARRRQRKSAILFVKLSALMGLPWIMEIVSWAVGGEDHYWYFTDAINVLRSVFIFIVFCCKPKVWEMLKKNSRISSSIRWFSRRVGRRTISCPASNEKRHEVTQSVTNVSAENDGNTILQPQENGHSKPDSNPQGIANSAFDAQEMQNQLKTEK